MMAMFLMSSTASRLVSPMVGSVGDADARLRRRK